MQKMKMNVMQQVTNSEAFDSYEKIMISDSLSLTYARDTVTSTIPPTPFR